MASKERETIYVKALWILNDFGTPERANELRFVMIYEDEKILVEGLLPLDLSVDGYDSLYIGVKLPTDTGDLSPTFEMPQKKNRSATKAVYHWKNAPRFMRPGRWQAYLDYLIRQRQKRYDETGSLDGEPIDDDELFSELG